MTYRGARVFDAYDILIHTSVKLVTPATSTAQGRGVYFNPHEREARDLVPHDVVVVEFILIHTSVKLVTREAVYFAVEDDSILIHTSVKLVTLHVDTVQRKQYILIHTSVKLVTILSRHYIY